MDEIPVGGVSESLSISSKLEVSLRAIIGPDGSVQELYPRQCSCCLQVDINGRQNAAATDSVDQLN